MRRCGKESKALPLSVPGSDRTHLTLKYRLPLSLLPSTSYVDRTNAGVSRSPLVEEKRGDHVPQQFVRITQDA